jgi:hypothetical protein
MSVDRDEISALLLAHGEHLRRAAAISAEHHAAVAKLLPAAVEAGLSKREIARLAGVGRPWINRALDQAES